MHDRPRIRPTASMGLCAVACFWLVGGQVMAQIEQDPLPPMESETVPEESRSDEAAPFEGEMSKDTFEDRLRTDTIDDDGNSIFSPRSDADRSYTEMIDAIDAPGLGPEPSDENAAPVEISDRRATLRALEKVTARIKDLDVGLGETVEFKSLQITLRTCNKRPPEETPETTAFLEIIDNKPDGEAAEVFTGWMFASSPALNALEHPVYDVWVIDCNITDPAAGAGSL